MIKQLSSLILRVMGWKVEADLPSSRKYVLIGAPHTSNWDLFYSLTSFSSIGLKFNWVMKHTMFFWPLGSLWRLLGGVPVNRSSGSSFLRKMIKLFQERDDFVLAIAPEGTRSRTEYWRTGFYLVAMKAEVPVVMAYIDYPAKIIGIGGDNGVFMPSGNLAEDMKKVAAFYQGKRGRHINLQGPVAIKKGKV